MRSDGTNIYLLTNDFPYGKAEPYLYDEMNSAQSLKVNITLVPLNRSEIENLREEFQGFRILNINTNDYSSAKIPFDAKLFLLWIHFLDLIKAGKAGYFKSNYKNNYALLLRLYYTATKLCSDINQKTDESIVYSYWCDNLALISIFIKLKNRNVKIVSRAHGFDVFKEQTKYGYIPFRFFQMKHLNRLFSVSKSGAKQLANDNIKHGDKITVARLGVFDMGSNPHSSDKLNIVTCCHIRNVKRLDIIADVLRDFNFDLTWHVIGTGLDLEKLKEKTRDLPKNIYVIFHGYLDKEQLNNFYKTQPVTALISTSSSEGIPVSMMEAISYGIPIVSTDVGGCSEIVTESTGVLISKDNTATELLSVLKSSLNSKLNTPDFRKGVKRFWNENFNAEKNYSSFYKDLSEL